MIAEITIPEIWSMRAALCVVGIIYMVVCFLLVGIRGLRGWANVLTLWAVGFVFLMIVKPECIGFNGPQDGWECLRTRVFSDEGKSIDLKDLMGASAGEYGYYKDGIKYNFEPEVYALNDPQAPGFYINPWIFHPGCLFWCPFIVAIITAGGWFVGDDK